MLDYQQLKEILPHAYPFLLIDRVEEYKEGEHLVAIKNITSNEWCCCGNSSHNNTLSRQTSAQGYLSLNQENDSLIFPEVLLIEAAAQAALVLYHLSKVKPGERPRYILGSVNSEFLALPKPAIKYSL